MRRPVLSRADADARTRREFLAFAARTMLGASVLPLLPSMAFAADGDAPRRPTAKHLITLFMSGGMSHLDTFDPKPGAATQGPVQALATSADGIQLSEHFPLTARQMHRAALVRSLTSNQGAHEQGTYFMRTSFTQRGDTRHPTLGSWLLKCSGRVNPTIPGAVVIGGGSDHPGSGWMGPEQQPLAIGNAAQGLKDSRPPRGIDDARYRARLDALAAIDRDFESRWGGGQAGAYREAYDQALKLMRSEDLAAFDIAREPEAVRDAYGEAPFAQGCLLARRLVEHGVRHVEVVLGGWDTHADNFERVADQAAILDRALSTLLLDLASRGLLEETLVAVTTEFGRSPEITDQAGRNHHPRCFSALLAGGGVRGGVVHGASDADGFAPARDPMTVPDFNATIAWALGLPVGQAFTAPNGRPFTVADQGRPVTALFA